VAGRGVVAHDELPRACAPWSALRPRAPALASSSSLSLITHGHDQRRDGPHVHHVLLVAPVHARAWWNPPG